MHLKKNVGKTDKIIRISLGVVLIVLAIVLNTWWLFILAVAALATAFVGFCGLYRVFGINTCKIDRKA